MNAPAAPTPSQQERAMAISCAGGLLYVLRNGHPDRTIEIDARRAAAVEIEELRQSRSIQGITYDVATDVVTIDGIKYARELFKHFAASPYGTTYRIVERLDGVIAIRTDRDDRADALVNAASALAKRTLEYVGEQPHATLGEVLDADAEMRELSRATLSALSAFEQAKGASP